MKNLKFKESQRRRFSICRTSFSWVVLSGLIMNMLDPDTGLVTSIINSITGEQVQVLTDTRYFVPMLVITDIYKGAGWGTIIYFAALSGIDPTALQAARSTVRWSLALHSITLPSITPTIVVMLILDCNNIVNAVGQIFMLYSALVYSVADITSTPTFTESVSKMRTTRSPRRPVCSSRLSRLS